jgi:hypothetical protein
MGGKTAIEISTTTSVSEITVLNSRFMGQSENSIRAWGGDDIAIAGCVFEDIGKNPVKLMGTTAAVVLNNEMNKTGAIRVERGTALIEGNECMNNPFLAISVIDPAEVEIRGNYIHSMLPEPPCCEQGDKTGIGVVSNIGGGAVLIADNTIGDRLPGIWITGPPDPSLPRMGPITITGNVFEQCRQAAMVINRAIGQLTIEDNYFSDITGKDGAIQLKDVEAAAVGNNVYEGLEGPFVRLWGGGQPVAKYNNVGMN